MKIFASTYFVFLCLCIACVIERSNQCKCINPVENLDSLICEAKAFALVRIIGDPRRIDENTVEYRANILEVFAGKLKHSGSTTLRTASTSAACGARLTKKASYYVAIYDNHRVTSCGVIASSDLPEEFDFDSVDCDKCVKCPSKRPACKCNCRTCAISEPSCESCSVATCCDYLKCAVLSCDDQSYLDRSRFCCPGECVNVCTGVVCPQGQVCKAQEVQCLVPPCVPEPKCVNLYCTEEAKECCDGSYVGRDPNNNCEFAKCPTCPKTKS